MAVSVVIRLPRLREPCCEALLFCIVGALAVKVSPVQKARPAGWIESRVCLIAIWDLGPA